VRLLCDHNVDGKYVETFRRTDWITVTTESEVLSAEAYDPEIMTYAEAHDWVVFTSDRAFDVDDDESAIDPATIECGVITYRQVEDPAPGLVVDAVGQIARQYYNHSEIVEYVPGRWIQSP
jgi:predicted nuclease of predicted toxin-antitoxin system